GWWFVLFSHVPAPPCFRGEWSGPRSGNPSTSPRPPDPSPDGSTSTIVRVEPGSDGGQCHLGLIDGVASKNHLVTQLQQCGRRPITPSGDTPGIHRQRALSTLFSG